MKYIVAVILFVALIGLSLSWSVYKYKECKKVGHATFYCLMTLGK